MQWFQKQTKRETPGINNEVKNRRINRIYRKTNKLHQNPKHSAENISAGKLRRKYIRRTFEKRSIFFTK